MKNCLIALLMAFLVIPMSAQSSLDSIVVFRRDTARMKLIYESNLWGVTLNRIGSIYDDSLDIWSDLNRDNYLYNGDQLIEVLTYLPEDDSWIAGWRSIFTYPTDTTYIKEFYFIEDGIDEKAWQVNYNKSTDPLITSDMSIVDDETLLLEEYFQDVVEQTDTGYVVTSERIDEDGDWNAYSRRIVEIEDDLIVRCILMYCDEDVWYNVRHVIYTYTDQNQIKQKDYYQYVDDEWESNILGSEIYYYDEVVINPPELDEENIIMIVNHDRRLMVKSKVDLERVAIYTLDADVIYSNSRPRTTEVIITDLKGYYLVEVLTVDKRKKIEKVFIN